MSSRRIAMLVKKNHSTIVRRVGIRRQLWLLQAVEEGRVRIGHAMRLARAPKTLLPELLHEAAELSQPERERRVAQVRKDPVIRARRVSPVDERCVMAALRSLKLVGAVEDKGPVRAALELVRQRVDELLGLNSAHPVAVLEGGALRHRLSVVGSQSRE